LRCCRTIGAKNGSVWRTAKTRKSKSVVAWSRCAAAGPTPTKRAEGAGHASPKRATVPLRRLCLRQASIPRISEGCWVLWGAAPHADLSLSKHFDLFCFCIRSSVSEALPTQIFPHNNIHNNNRRNHRYSNRNTRSIHIHKKNSNSNVETTADVDELSEEGQVRRLDNQSSSLLLIDPTRFRISFSNGIDILSRAACPCIPNKELRHGEDRASASEAIARESSEICTTEIPTG
jgi:hypothetical protein